MYKKPLRLYHDEQMEKEPLPLAEYLCSSLRGATREKISRVRRAFVQKRDSAVDSDISILGNRTPSFLQTDDSPLAHTVLLFKLSVGVKSSMPQNMVRRRHGLDTCDINIGMRAVNEHT